MNHTGPDGWSYLCDKVDILAVESGQKTLIYIIMRISAGMTMEVPLGYHQA